MSIDAMTIKAIETEYKGYRFRSRLEARWAVFFDALGYRWEYEPEGYDLGSAGWYLPDFRLTMPCGHTQWIEVKKPGDNSDKAAAFDHILEKRHTETFGAVCVQGDPFDYFGPGSGHQICPNCGCIDGVQDDPAADDHWGDDLVLNTWCCHGRVRGSVVFRDVCDCHDDYTRLHRESWREWAAEVNKAALAARGARFEHGEKGAAKQ